MEVIDFFADGIFDENSFLIIDEKTGEKAIVDPSFEKGFFYECDNIKYILLTHGHFDHIASALEIKEKFGSQIVCHSLEADVLKNDKVNLSILFGDSISFEADILLNEFDSLQLGETEIKVLHTPGHTKGSCCYIAENHLFSGDTIMKGTIGRTDFPTGDYTAIMQSIKKLKALNENYIVHCGHGENSLLDEEKKYNEFFNQR